MAEIKSIQHFKRNMIPSTTVTVTPMTMPMLLALVPKDITHIVAAMNVSVVLPDNSAANFIATPPQSTGLGNCGHPALKRHTKQD
jgi:hypothetical protein